MMSNSMVRAVARAALVTVFMVVHLGCDALCTDETTTASNDTAFDVFLRTTKTIHMDLDSRKHPATELLTRGSGTSTVETSFTGSSVPRSDLVC